MIWFVYPSVANEFTFKFKMKFKKRFNKLMQRQRRIIQLVIQLMTTSVKDYSMVVYLIKA